MTCSKSRSRSRRRADAIAQAGCANGLGAMLAAEEGAVLLEPVADDADAAVLAGRRQRVDRAFETVEGVGGAVHADLKRLVVVVSAGFTSRHDNPRNGCGFGPALPRRFRPLLRPDGRAFARHSRRVRHFGRKIAGKRAREHEPFAAPMRLTHRTPDRVSGATGAAGWVVKCPYRGSQLAWWRLRSAPQW